MDALIFVTIIYKLSRFHSHFTVYKRKALVVCNLCRKGYLLNYTSSYTQLCKGLQHHHCDYS